MITNQQQKNEFSLIPHSTKKNEWQMAKNGINITPGTMQYKVSKDNIISLTKDHQISQNDLENTHWTLERHTKENLRKLTPNTKTGNANEWKLIMVMRSHENGYECLKGALLNKDTNEIALMSCLNKMSSAVYTKRMVKSMHPDYKICRCKMTAPLLFWHELKNRLIY